MRSYLLHPLACLTMPGVRIVSRSSLPHIPPSFDLVTGGILSFRWIKIGLAFSRLVDQKGIDENMASSRYYLVPDWGMLFWRDREILHQRTGGISNRHWQFCAELKKSWSVLVRVFFYNFKNNCRVPQLMSISWHLSFGEHFLSWQSLRLTPSLQNPVF